MQRHPVRVGHLLVQALALLLPLCLWGWWTLAQPRPYYIQEDDPEAHFYFSTRLLMADKPLVDIRHPGLTAIYLLYGLSQVPHWDASPQQLFAAARLVVAIVTGLSLLAFMRWATQAAGAAVALLALCVALAWPPFLYYFDYFGSQSLEVPIAVGALTCLIRIFEGSSGRLRLIVLGALLATGLATKLTFIPLVIAVAAGLVHHAAFHGASLRWVLAGAAAAGAIQAAPVLGEIPAVFLHLLVRGDIWPHGITDGWNTLITINLPLAVVVAIVLCGIFATSLARWRSIAPLGSLLVTLAASLIYVMSVDDGGGPYDLRLTTVTMLVVPFAIVAFGKHLRRRAGSTPFLPALIVAIAAAVLVPALVERNSIRARFIAAAEEQVRLTTDWLHTFDDRGGRVAIWDGSPGGLLGEASFYYYGNHAFASDAFDGELLERFPQWAFLRLREVFRLSERAARGESAGYGVPEDSHGATGQWWRRHFPAPPIGYSDELFAGEVNGVRLTAVMAPVEEVLREVNPDPDESPEERLSRLVESRVGEVSARTHTIAGIEWLVLEVQASRHGHP